MNMEQGPGLEDCLKLLKGERDEQRLAGLLLATKFIKGDDYTSIQRVYDAVGVRFLDRLLMSGMGKGADTVKKGDNQDSYLELSVTILAALCRVPEIAASKDMISKVPVILEILSNRADPSISNECYEFLFLVANASADGVTHLYESKGMKVLASCMPSLTDGSHSVELTMRIVQLILTKLHQEIIYTEYVSEVSHMVATIARQFALLHNSLKFDALHLLSTILSSRYAAPVRDALRVMSNDDWATYIRVGVVAVLQSRFASEKLQALILAESIMCIAGESWLIDQKIVPDETEPITVDRCLLLVLESSRVEVAVLLNDISCLKYEASKDSSSTAETLTMKQQNLAVSFSLIEKIIKLISSICGDEGSPISESTLSKVIAGLNETTQVVLEFLEDAKDHGQREGNDLLASVRIIGSYLAETPYASMEKVQDLLEYMLSIKGADEPSPFYSICFLLPMLCQVTMEIEGCRMLVSFGGHKTVMECLARMISHNIPTAEESSTIFLACDTLMNLLLKREEIPVPLDGSSVVHLLRALAHWAENINDQSVIMMAATISSLTFESTSEKALLSHPNFDHSILNSLSKLIVRSLATYDQEMCDDINGDGDLQQIIAKGYASWADRFPSIKEPFELRDP